MALTGAVYGNRCFNTPSDAVDAFYSAAAPAQTPGSTSYVNEWVKESGVWRMKSWSLNSSGAATLRFNVAAPIPTFQACDPAESFLDGVTIGWGVAAAIVAVACIKMMQKAK